ncbi:MAG TPA: type I 3-dehydroquinate dehydratase [Deltaproteobacteria bacterium]|nr:type I 3-dehydroquinate dehydratase [Deltaproteobacteria bacterium]
MTAKKKIAQTRLSMLQLAEKRRNVYEACRRRVPLGADMAAYLVQGLPLQQGNLVCFALSPWLPHLPKTKDPPGQINQSPLESGLPRPRGAEPFSLTKKSPYVMLDYRAPASSAQGNSFSPRKPFLQECPLEFPPIKYAAAALPARRGGAAGAAKGFGGERATAGVKALAPGPSRLSRGGASGKAMKIGEIEVGGGRTAVVGVIIDGLRAATLRKAAAHGADILELRIDTFEGADPEKLSRGLRRIRSGGRSPAASMPLLATVRSAREGSPARLCDALRLELFEAAAPWVDAVDIEISSSAIAAQVAALARRRRLRLIASFHDFRGTPGAARLASVVDEGKALGAHMVKIAARADRPAQLRRLAALLLDRNDLAVVAMGGFAAASRVFFPMLGSLLTYGAVTEATAPGQMPLRELRKALERFSPARLQGGRAGVLPVNGS